jgi:NAD(P)-dependent dehydrogenase (short-subunit alcohol dehydrogenase family)
MSHAAARMIQTAPEGDGLRDLVINAASMVAFEGQVGQSAYSTSRGRVAGMPLPAARKLASVGARLCAIARGLADAT